MSKKFCFSGHFEKQYGKLAQTLFKSASQHIYHIYLSVSRKVSWSMSLLLKCQILGLLVNTFPADRKYALLNWDKLTIPIQI